jgi:hypothetical protein
MSLSIALSLGVVSIGQAAIVGKAVEKSFRSYEELKATKSGELAEVFAKKAMLSSLKSDFAKRINTNVDEVNRVNASRTNANGLRDFALMKVKDHSNKGAEVSSGVDAIEALNTIAKEIKRLESEAKTDADKTEITSLQKSVEVISEFVSTIGELGYVGLVNADGSTPVLAKEAMETLIKITPDILVKFEGSRREAYTQLIGKINELIRSGKMAPADALRKVLNDDKKLEALKGCKL